MNLSKEKLLFHHYYANWLRIYKEVAIREVTIE
ncbi:integrase [Streptococcus suis]|uniref:Integrase n=1 Tax=Streptococcus suis TaxID=1307 RepID=A0A0Z8V404_STRSU|nr:integrase [Streptococcus suis]